MNSLIEKYDGDLNLLYSKAVSSKDLEEKMKAWAKGLEMLQ